MKTNIDLSDSDREGVAKLLNTLLADEYLLYTKTRKYHWNVTGPQFNELHRFFAEHYESLSDFADEVAERVRTLGGWPFGTLSEFLKHARLRERPGESLVASEMISDLVADHEAIIRTLRVDLESVAEKYHDIGTNNFLTDLLEKHEKMAWMLRAFLEGESA